LKFPFPVTSARVRGVHKVQSERPTGTQSGQGLPHRRPLRQQEGASAASGLSAGETRCVTGRVGGRGLLSLYELIIY